MATKQDMDQIALRTNSIIEAIQSQRNQALDQGASIAGELAVQNSTIRKLAEEIEGYKKSIESLNQSLMEEQRKCREAQDKILQLEVALATKSEACEIEPAGCEASPPDEGISP